MAIKVTILALTVASAASVLSGCSQTTESQVTSSGNSARTTPVVSNANSAVTPSSNAPAIAATNANSSTAEKRSAPTANAPAPQIGSGGDDFSLFTDIRGQLSSDKELATAVIIDVKQGAVTLTGNVSSQAQRAKAEQIVQNVKGIKSLKNNLRVAS